MESNSLFLIDIDKIIAEKMGAKAKCVPRFVRSYLKHIVHQDELYYNCSPPHILKYFISNFNVYDFG